MLKDQIKLYAAICHAEELADLAAAEAEAVDREDFEAAGGLGECQDGIKATLGGLQEDVWACEASAQAAVALCFF